MRLTRFESNMRGIFGGLYDDDGMRICYTLEHAYLLWPESYRPKMPPGIYTCERGVHTLPLLGQFETFEIMNVPGHQGILFHIGNYNSDSAGCVLLGMSQTDEALIDSRIAFNKFMDAMTGIDSFQLTVTGEPNV